MQRQLIHQSLEHKLITYQVRTEIAEANSFKATHTFDSDTVPVGSHFQQKHQMRNTELPFALGPSCHPSSGTGS